MALIQCGECAKEISDQARACPHCGCPRAPSPAPARPAAPPLLKKNFGCGSLIMVVFTAMVVLWAIGTISSDNKGARKSPAPRQSAAVAAETQRAAIDRFAGMPGIRHAEWLDGDFLIAVTDNGQSWQPVADAACVWIRRQGAPPGFAVVVLEASALQNKRWEQMARARCN